MGAMLGAFMAVLDIQIITLPSKEIQGGIGCHVGNAWISTSLSELLKLWSFP